MILRDIFTELEDIFQFHFEKNRNGSYRVNTVIASLVYPELYQDGDFSTNDLRYFLAHPEDSYQNYPNIRNSFSELMHPKPDSHRFPIIEFCNQIDISAMYDYYRRLCLRLQTELPENDRRLQAFLKRIAERDPIFHARLKLICHEPYQFLTWILIFSMFHAELANQRFESFLKSQQTLMPDVSIGESDVRHRLSGIIQQKRRRLNLLTVLLIVLNGIMVICALLPFFPIQDYGFPFLAESRSLVYIVLLIFSILLLLLWKYHAYVAEQCAHLQALHDYIDLYPSTAATIDELLKQPRITLEPFQDNSASHRRRSRLRRITTPLSIGLGILAILPSLWINSFPLLIAFTAFILVVTLYFDLILHNRYTRACYDRMSEPSGTRGDPWRGLAKIYRWEYEKTGFDLSHDFYDNRIQVHSAACYRHIFYIAYDRIRYSLFYRHNLFLWFNICILFLEALGLFWDKTAAYLHLPNLALFDLFIAVYLVALGIYNTAVLIYDVHSYSHLSLLAYGSAHAEENARESERLFLSLRAQGVIQEADWVRGVSTYDMALFEQGYTAEQIFPESDRMQFQHRIYQLRSLLFDTLCFGYVILFAVLVWHCGFYWAAIPLSVLTPIAYRLLIRFYLPRRHRRRIIRRIQSLQAREETPAPVRNAAREQEAVTL